jgi:hypothetical protein
VTTNIRVLILIIKVVLFLLVITSNFMKLEAFTFNMYSGRGQLPTYEIYYKNGLTLDVPVFQGTNRGLTSFKEIMDLGNWRTLAFFTNYRAKTLCNRYPPPDSVSLKAFKFERFTC